MYNIYALSSKPREDFGFLFVEDHRELLKSNNFYEWAFEEIGGKNKIASDQLAQAIAWSGTYYFTEMCGYVKDRMLRRRSV
jgi:hypothetical protein